MPIMSQFVTRSWSIWWLALLQGSVMVLLGLGLLIWTEQVASVIYTILGIYLLVLGLGTVINGLVDRTRALSPWQIGGGVLSTLGGLLAILNPMLGILVVPGILVYIIAIGLILNGLLQLLGQVRVWDMATGRYRIIWNALLLGILKLGLALFIIVRSQDFSVLLLQITGVLIILGGLVLMGLGWKLRSRNMP